jgi:hypothetical protein
VIRSTDREIAGSDYRLWTTLKVPQGESIETIAACSALTGADEFLLMPANGIFALGVGHVRRKTSNPATAPMSPAAMMTRPPRLDPAEWNVLLALKEELRPMKSAPTPGPPAPPRPAYPLAEFCASPNPRRQKGHRPLLHLPRTRQTFATGKRVTRFNGLFHWGSPWNAGIAPAAKSAATTS